MKLRLLEQYPSFPKSSLFFRTPHIQPPPQTGVDLDMCDYDGRTALHQAVTAGNMAVVRFLVNRAKCGLNPLDRWNSTPLDDGLDILQSSVLLTSFFWWCIRTFQELFCE